MKTICSEAKDSAVLISSQVWQVPAQPLTAHQLKTNYCVSTPAPESLACPNLCDQLMKISKVNEYDRTPP